VRVDSSVLYRVDTGANSNADANSNACADASADAVADASADACADTNSSNASANADEADRAFLHNESTLDHCGDNVNHISSVNSCDDDADHPRAPQYNNAAGHEYDAASVDARVVDAAAHSHDNANVGGKRQCEREFAE
jgi:hypothetical protein